MAASNLYDTWGDFNKQMVTGKTQKITAAPMGDPQWCVWKSGGITNVGFAVWYKCTCVSSASYNYVGMTRTAAEACAAAMQAKFLRPKDAWEFKKYYENNGWWYGWFKRPYKVDVLDSDIRVVHDQGAMYHVEIEVSCTDEKYSQNPSLVTFDYPACMQDI